MNMGCVRCEKHGKAEFDNRVNWLCVCQSCEEEQRRDTDRLRAELIDKNQRIAELEAYLCRDKPSECINGCPPNQVCDFCQYAPARRIAELEDLLRDAVDALEYWFNRENMNGISEQDYKMWHALGYGSRSYRNAKAALRGGGE
jgi:hypothetical protein